MVKTWKVTFPAKEGDDPRRAYVYLPVGYEEDQNARFPVLYMFDGHNVFFDEDATYGKSWGLADYLDAVEAPVIVAAIECSHDPDNGRIKEYSPYDFHNAKLGDIDGRGEQTMDWLIRVFKKQIDRQFRTLPDRENTFIAGSSMGGLISLYAVLKHNDVFSRAACLSPSIWTNMPELEKLVKTSRLQPDTAVYLDYGSREIKFHKNMREQFRQMTDLLLEKRVFVTSRIVPFGDHCEASWEKQLPIVFDVLLYE